MNSSTSTSEVKLALAMATAGPVRPAGVMASPAWA